MEQLRLGRARKRREHDLLLCAGLTFLTARRLIHETGLYDEVEDEARTLGLLEQPTLANPAPGPSELELARALREREATIGPPEAPRTWTAPIAQGPIERPGELAA